MNELEKKFKARKDRLKGLIILIVIVVVIPAIPLICGDSKVKETDKTLYLDESVAHEVSFVYPVLIDLGSREDGYYYSIVYTWEDYDYFVVRKYGTKPKVRFYEAPEGLSALRYYVSNDLARDDFSDLITEEIIENEPEIAEKHSDNVFTVIDLDNDVLLSADEWEDARSVEMTYGIIFLISAIFWFVAGIPIIALLIVFTVQYFKTKKEIGEIKGNLE